MAKSKYPKPFDAAITRFFKDQAPSDIRDLVKNAAKKQIITPDYPYAKRLDTKTYEDTLEDLQIELVKMQSWTQATGARIAILFEGRDAAGKGGTIKRFREFLNPRSARLVALSKPSDTERSQWYFQRYITHMPSAGEIVFFDRSWYNRGVVEHVFDWCTPDQRARFFNQVTEFEDMLVNDGIHLIKLWLNVSRAEQLRRFLSRESDPLKQWKLSMIDVKGLSRWDAYTQAITENFARTHCAHAPWSVIRTDDKKRARIAAIRIVLSQLDYTLKDPKTAGAPDQKITGGPDLIHG